MENRAKYHQNCTDIVQTITILMAPYNFITKQYPNLQARYRIVEISRTFNMTSSASSREHAERTSIVAETTQTQANRAPEIIIGAGNLTLREKLRKPRSRHGRRRSSDRRIPFSRPSRR